MLFRSILRIYEDKMELHYGRLGKGYPIDGYSKTFEIMHIVKFGGLKESVAKVADAVGKDINVVVSNMATLERLYRRVGLQTMIVDGPKTSKTRTSRQEVIAWKIGKMKANDAKKKQQNQNTID